MGTVKLSKPQETLLKRIKRCPMGCYIERHELKTAGVLMRAGFIALNESLTVGRKAI